MANFAAFGVYWESYHWAKERPASSWASLCSPSLSFPVLCQLCKSGQWSGLWSCPESWGWEDFLYDTGLHYPLRIPKLSPSFLFLSLCPKWQSPIFGVLAYPCIKGPYRAENPMITLCYNHAALLSIIVPAQRPRAVGSAKPVVS